ncbi:MAG: hypothetical protein U9R28_09185 [Pseudomonadota bacterium]|nr:hypothetical protein [Pseudomonadota bacterium]
MAVYFENSAGEYEVYKSQKPSVDIMLGFNDSSEQYGLIAQSANRNIAMDLNHPQTIIATGNQGSGKSYTSGSILEMSLQRILGINHLPNKMATVVFHYSNTQSYRPEARTMTQPNDQAEQIKLLAEKYHAKPEALEEVVYLVPPDKLAERQIEYKGSTVLPIQFKADDLKTQHWKLLMGAEGNKAAYLRIINNLMREHRENLSIDLLREGFIKACPDEKLIEFGLMRLDFAEQYVSPESQITNFLQPGRLVIVDLRDELIEKDEALTLFMILMDLFSEAQHNGGQFNKLVMFDECHKYIQNRFLVNALTEAVREMRHRGTSIILASQDPQSIPATLLELASMMFLFKFNSPLWLAHLQKANTALRNLTPEKLNALKPGEAYVWANKSSDISFTRQAHKIQCRPRVTKHGGDSVTAVR